MSKVLIIYSSIGGNTELTVQKLVEQIDNRVSILIKRVDTTTLEDLENQDCIVLACPTYGQGALEVHFSKFLKTIDGRISTKNFAIIGLGDTKYYPEYLTESSSILEEFVKQNNANLIVTSLRIGMPPIKFIEKLVPRWTETLISKI